MIATNFEATHSAYRVSLQAKPGLAYRRELRHGIGQAVDQGKRSIVVDCSSWQELDLILLSALVDCAAVCDERGVSFELEHLAEDLRSRIDALRLSERLGLTT